jgi:hypothetical protein
MPSVGKAGLPEIKLFFLVLKLHPDTEKTDRLSPPSLPSHRQ